MEEHNKDAERHISIPEAVVRMRGLQPNAKLLFGEIACLAKQEGYCYATNDHFADMLGVEPSNIKRLVASLVSVNLIDVQYGKCPSGTFRKIYPLTRGRKNAPPATDGDPQEQGAQKCAPSNKAGGAKMRPLKPKITPKI